MIEALKEAKKSLLIGEVPIGCVIVFNDKIIARGHNLREINQDATQHAEIIAIRQANLFLKSWRLKDCSLFVTLEPCPMCAGAILNSRIESVYYGCADLKAGCAGSLMNILGDLRFNHHVEIEKGICRKDCQKMLSDFFKDIRENKNND